MANIEIGGRLHSTATGNVVTGANEVLDDTKNKKQSVINAEVDETIGDDNTAGTIKGRIKTAEGKLDTLNGDSSTSGSVAKAVADAKTELIGGATSNGNTLKKVEDRTATLETAVGSNGSVDQRIATAKSEVIGDAASDYNTLGKLEDKIQAEASARQDTITAETNRATTRENQIYDLVHTPEQHYVTVATYADLANIASPSDDTVYRVSSYNGKTSQVDNTVYSEYGYDGTNFVFLCVKSQIDEVYDISAHHSNNTYVDLAAALDGGNNIPQELRRGGMSVKYVQSSDNKYVQYRLMADEWSINTEDWAIADDDVLIENPEFITLYLDAEKKIVWGIKTDGNIYFGNGCPPQIKSYVQSHLQEILADLDTKVDKVAGKGLSANDYTDNDKEIVSINELVENPEYMDIEADAEKRILGGRKSDGTKVENMPTETPSYLSKSTEDKEYIEITKDRLGRIIEAINCKGERIFGIIPPQILSLIEDVKNQNKKDFIDISDGTAINNGLNETTACGSQFAFDLKTGIAAVWVSSAWLEYGEKFGKSQLILFPIAQPNNRKYVTFDVKGQEYTAVVPWDNTTTTYTSVGLNVANLISLGNGKFRILYFDGNYAWMYRDYDYINDVLTDPVYIEYDYDGGNKKLTPSCLIDFLVSKGIDVTDESTRYSYSDFTSPIQKVNNISYCAFAGYNTYPVLFSSDDDFESVTPFAVFPTKCDYEASFVLLNGAIHYIHRNYEHGIAGYTLGKSVNNGNTWTTKTLLTGDNNRPRLMVYNSKLIIGYGLRDDKGRNRRRVRFEIGTDILNMQKMFDLEDRWGQVYFSMQFINGEMYLVWSDAQSGINSQAETQAERNDLRNSMKFRIINEFINF